MSKSRCPSCNELWQDCEGKGKCTFKDFDEELIDKPKDDESGNGIY